MSVSVPELKRSFSVEYLHPLRFLMTHMFSRPHSESQPQISLTSLVSTAMGMMLRGEQAQETMKMIIIIMMMIACT